MGRPVIRPLRRARRAFDRQLERLRWRIRGIRVVAGGDEIVADHAGWYELRVHVLTMRNNGGRQSYVITDTCYLNKGETVKPAVITDVAGYLLGTVVHR